MTARGVATGPAGGSGQGRQSLAALQEALAAEQAASYGYGVVGAHLTGKARASATADWIAHQRARDELEQLLRSRGATPRAAAVAYRLPIAVANGGQAIALAVILEDRVAAACLSLVAVSDPGLREFAAVRLQASALRAAAWRGSTVAFPGLQAAAAGGHPVRSPQARGASEAG